MKPKIIFDTDIGCDCDDTAALDLLLSADRAGECKLLGVTYSSDTGTGPACIHSILSWYGYGSLPIGRMDVGPDTPIRPDTYATAVAEAFPTPDAPTYETAPEAVALLRQLLAENDGVTLLATGFLSNFGALLRSGPDKSSPLTGVELVREKVEKILIMAGDFAHQSGCTHARRKENGEIEPVSEWNIKWDISAARDFFELCPVPVDCLPWETGDGMYTGKPMVEAGGGKTPDSLAFVQWGAVNGRDSWDPATAYAAIYGPEDILQMTTPGRIVITEDGVSHFDTSKGGMHRLIYPAVAKDKAAAVIDRKIMRLYSK